MNIDLVRYRQNADMDQVDVANALGISKMQVNLYEQASDTVPMGLLVKWLQVLGVDLATAMSHPIQTITRIDPGSPYTELYRRLNLLNQYIDSASPIDKLDIPTPPATPNDFRQKLKLYRRKPNVVLTGRFDAGKSHMANTMLRSKKLPVGYQPATSVITFIRHIEDRPQWCQDDVLIVAEGFFKDENGKLVINLLLLDDQERCATYCIHAGNFDVLQKYGVHGENEDIAAYAAVVYVDSPMLRACNLIDLPGFSDQASESKDTEKANAAAEIADVLIYASPAKGHINGQDIVPISKLLRSLSAPENQCSNFPTLGNLFIVATHADPSISDNQLKDISYKASTRLYNELRKGEVLESCGQIRNRNISEKDLRARFFTFWSDIPNRYQELFEDLTKLLGEFLPQAFMSYIDREIKAIKEDNMEKYAKEIKAYQITRDDIDTKRKQLQILEGNEENRKRETQEKRDQVFGLIEDLEETSQASFEWYAEQLITVDTVEQIIRDEYEEKKEAKENLSGYLINRLQYKLEQTIMVSSEKLTPAIENFLGSYEEALLKLPDLDISVEIPFDSKGAFLGGITGLTSIGALSAWAAALGNLGGYILVAQVVSLLSALGISISGGTAAVIAFVATIGGPITLGIGLAAALAFAAWGLLGESWQKRLAKETIKYFQDQDIVGKFVDANDQFWQDTTNTFTQGADAVELKWNNYIEHLREITSPTLESKERIEEILKILEAGKDFFGGILWSNINLNSSM